MLQTSNSIRVGDGILACNRTINNMWHKRHSNCMRIAQVQTLCIQLGRSLKESEFDLEGLSADFNVSRHSPTTSTNPLSA
jgi:hypothetical protein